MTDTRRKMAKGAFWSVSFRLAVRAIGLLSTLFLARLLVPADFGLVAMATSILAALEIMSAFSFDIALIQNPSAQRRHYDTAWTFNVIFGLVNACILLALAGPAAEFYGEPRVTNIMRWFAVYAALQGFNNIGIVAFQKDLELHKEFSFGVTTKLVAFTVTLLLAYALRSYWALVAGTMASTITGLALSYWMHPYRPRLSLAARGELFHFSKWMLINNALIFLIHRSADLAIGKLVGAQALGTYSIAYEISNLPTTELVFPISRAIFPGYSKMAGSLQELRRGFVDVLSIILLFVVPAGVGICVLAEPLVRAVLGTKWEAAIPLVQMLSVFGVLRASTSNCGAVFLALGIPRVLTYLTLLFLAIMLPAFWIWVPMYGAAGAAKGLVVAASIQMPVVFAIVARSIGLGLPALLSVAWRPLLAAALMAAAIETLRGHLAAEQAGDLMLLSVLVPFGVAVYTAGVFALWSVVGRPAGGEALFLDAGRMLVKRIKRRNVASG